MTQHLETIFDECLAWLQAGETIDAILRRYPDDASELRSLLEMAEKLERTAGQEPPVNAMARVMARTHEKLSRSMRRTPGWFSGFFAVPVLVRAAVLTLIALTMIGGAVTRASQAVPGDWLYPLKLWTERARFSLTKNAENRAELRIDFASERLREAVEHYQRKGVLDKQLLNTMLDEARLAVQESVDLPELTQQRIVNRAAAVTNYQEATLKVLKAKAPPEMDQQLQPWIDRCQERERWMRGMDMGMGMDMDMNMDMDRGEKTDEQPQPPSQTRHQQMRRWMDNCPMW